MSQSNTRRTTMRWLVVSLLIFALSAFPRAVTSQQLKQVMVAVVESLPDTMALAQITRTPGPGSRTTILLRERNADTRTLASAMVAVFDSRRTHGEEPSLQIVINLYGHKRPESLTPNERALGELYLGRLRAAKVSEVDGIGPVRATTIALAPLHDRTPP